MAGSLVVADLGTLAGELVVFGGPCSNLQATGALIDAAARRGIPADRCICTGDTVAYCADPAATVAALRTFGCAVVAGNCERQLAEGAADCGCGFDAGSVCDRLSAGWYGHAARELGREDRAWMAGLPDIVTFRHGTRRCAAIHGGVTAINRFLWPSSPADAFAEEVAALCAAAGAVDTVFAGHCGLAFARRVAGVTWVNAGAIGLPPHDGRPLARFAVVPESGGVVFHRLAYDHEAAARAMQRAGLTQGYQDTLRTGIWPSEDILPPEMRRGVA